MPFSTNTFTYAGGAQTFTISLALGYLKQSDIKCFVVGELDGEQNQIFRAFTFDSEFVVRLTDALVVNDKVTVQRTVDKETLDVDFETGGDVTPRNLMILAKQSMMSTQEILDGRVAGFDPVRAAVEAKASQDAAAVSEAAALVSEGLADADATATAADRVQTGLDKTSATASAATATTQAGNASTSASEAAADAISTNADKIATAADKVATNDDAVLTAADLVSTDADQIAAAASASAASTSEINAASSEALNVIRMDNTMMSDSRANVALATIDVGITSIRTAGYATSGDGGGGLYRRVGSEPPHALKVRSADLAWWELVPDSEGINIKQSGAKGDDTTDDVTAINNAFAAGALLEAVVVPQDIFLTDAVIGIDGPSRVIGRGWQVDTDGLIGGSVLKAVGTGVADVLTLESTNTAGQGSTFVEGVVVSDLAIIHRGSGDGLNINNVIRARVVNVMVDCQNEGAVGMHTQNWGFFTTFDKCNITRFTTTGLKLGGLGSQHIVRDCHIGTTVATAVAAIETIRPDFIIDGGQYNVNLAGDDGIGILVNNTGGSAITGGRILNTLCEFNIAVKITGTTASFSSVVVEYPRWDLSVVKTGVIFDRASNCLLVEPQIKNPTSGVMAEWTSLSVDCGVVCNAKAARSLLTVHASATRPWMHVTGFLDVTARNLITTAPNLTVLVDNVKRLGTTRHNGVAWDKEFILVSDNAVVSYTPPADNGIVEVHSNTEVDEYILAQFKTASVAKMGSLVVGVKSTVDLTDGTLTGTTGVDGDLTVRADSASGKIYFENRTGASKFLFITFRQSV